MKPPSSALAAIKKARAIARDKARSRLAAPSSPGATRSGDLGYHPGIPSTWLAQQPPRPSCDPCRGDELCFCVECLSRGAL